MTKMVYKLFLIVLLSFSTFLLQSCDNQTSVVGESIRDKAVDELRHTLETEDKWVKVHAAEYLLALSYPDGINICIF